MTTLISIKTDPEVKKQAQELSKELGLSLSSVINAFLRQFVRDKSVSFTTKDSFNYKTQKELLEVLKDIKAGKNLSKAYSSENVLEAFKEHE